jgi:hypothetical protein
LIYIKTQGGQHLLIIEPDNLDRLRAGEPLNSPTGDVTVAFTPDLDWLRSELIAISSYREIMPEDIDELLHRGLIRPEVKGRVVHPMINIIPGSKISDA